MARILVADDDEQVRGLVCQMLQAGGHSATGVTDGRSALTKWSAAKDNFDLLITDILMPEMDGFDAIIEFRKTWPAAKMIAISGGGEERTETFLRTARKMGVSRTLRKPFDQKTLLAAVQEVLLENPPTSVSDTRAA